MRTLLGRDVTDEQAQDFAILLEFYHWRLELEEDGQIHAYEHHDEMEEELRLYWSAVFFGEHPDSKGIDEFIKMLKA